MNFNVSQFFLKDDGSFLSLNQNDGAKAVATKLGFNKALGDFDLVDAAILACYNKQANQAIANLEKTVANTRAKSASFGANVAVLQVRLDFTRNYTNILIEGLTS